MVISLKPYSAFMYDLVGSAGVEPVSLLRCTSAVFHPCKLIAHVWTIWSGLNSPAQCVAVASTRRCGIPIAPDACRG